MRNSNLINNKKGIIINTYEAGELYMYEKEVRERLLVKKAVLANSIFRDYLLSNGMKVKNYETKDVICVTFSFGMNSYEDEKKKLENKIKLNSNNELYTELLTKLEEDKDKYNKFSKEQIRTYYYKNGITIDDTHYKMLYRSSAKAKLGEVIFINERLYDSSIKYLTMGIFQKFKDGEPAKIVELASYSPLITSAIEDKVYIPVNDILIVKDQESYTKIMANVIELDENNNTKVTKKETEVSNIIWDGEMLLDENFFPSDCNGFILLRNHFFKACAFNTRIQQYYKDYCSTNGLDYSTYQVKDMFGNMHYVKDIKGITTNNAIKWLKFKDKMGRNPYDYWKKRVEKDNCMFGIVKTAHASKYGSKQRLSYQMINSLPLSKKDVEELAMDDIEYVKKLKDDDKLFCSFLHDKANDVNNYEMLASMLEYNRSFANTDWFKDERKDIIYSYVTELRNGRLRVHGDNLTMVSNPFELLQYSISGKYEPVFDNEEAVQCYTNRFKNDEYLAVFRSPQNSPNNVNYFHNVYKEEFGYFNLDINVIIVNSIGTDIQDRLNGCDFDSDMILTTNNNIIVNCAKECVNKFNTIVNRVPLLGTNNYNFTMEDYARMDNTLMQSKLGIGWSSNLAQLALSHYWNKPSERLEFAFCELSVIAQLVIDGSKRTYALDNMGEIRRYQRILPSVKPKFFKYVKEFQTRTQMNNFIKSTVSLNCPMDYLQEVLRNIPKASDRKTVDIMDLFIFNKDNSVTYRKFQIENIFKATKRYDDFIMNNKVKYNMNDSYNVTIAKENDYNKLLVKEENKFKKSLYKIKISNDKTMNRAILFAFNDTKYAKVRRRFLRGLFIIDKEMFLSQFKK